MNRFSLFLGVATFSAVIIGCSTPPITIDAAVGDAGRDAGRRDAGMTCTPITIPPPTAVTCTQADGRCFEAATTQAALTACFNAASDECSDCIDSDLLNCATTMGCADEFGCF